MLHKTHFWDKNCNCKTFICHFTISMFCTLCNYLWYSVIYPLNIPKYIASHHSAAEMVWLVISKNKKTENPFTIQVRVAFKSFYYIFFGRALPEWRVYGLEKGKGKHATKKPRELRACRVLGTKWLWSWSFYE